MGKSKRDSQRQDAGYLASYTHDHVLDYMHDAKILKTWANPSMMFNGNIQTRNPQLHQELNMITSLYQRTPNVGLRCLRYLNGNVFMIVKNDEVKQKHI